MTTVVDETDTMPACKVLVAAMCIVSVMGECVSQEVFARWMTWYQQKLKPCLRPCPNHFQSEFICGFDHGRQRYAVATSSCALTRRNACFDEDYVEVPIEECLVQLKFHDKDSKLEKQQERITQLIN